MDDEDSATSDSVSDNTRSAPLLTRWLSLRLRTFVAVAFPLLTNTMPKTAAAHWISFKARLLQMATTNFQSTSTVPVWETPPCKVQATLGSAHDSSGGSCGRDGLSCQWK